VQFLAINIPGVEAAGNISVLAGNSQADLPAFLAGYAAAVVSYDFRVGMILPMDNASAQQARVAFANGVAYHCGLCSSYSLYFGPNGGAISYPQYSEIPAGELPNMFGGYANYLVGTFKVEAVYVYPDPEIEVPQLYEALGRLAPRSSGQPCRSSAGRLGYGIQADAAKAIQTAWPELLAGRGGQSVPSPLGWPTWIPSSSRRKAEACPAGAGRPPGRAHRHRVGP